MSELTDTIVAQVHTNANNVGVEWHGCGAMPNVPTVELTFCRQGDGRYRLDSAEGADETLRRHQFGGEIDRALILIYESRNADADVNYVIPSANLDRFCCDGDARRELVGALRRIADDVSSNKPSRQGLIDELARYKKLYSDLVHEHCRPSENARLVAERCTHPEEEPPTVSATEFKGAAL